MHNFNPMLFPDTWPKALPPDDLIITCINIFLYILPGMYVCVLTQIKEDAPIIKKAEPSLKNKDIKLSDLMRRAS